MSEMISRVARAIEPLVEDTGFSVEDIARAAIEAMRTPTEAMLDAAATVERYAEPGEEWGPMIDAALSTPDTDKT